MFFSRDNFFTSVCSISCFLQIALSGWLTVSRTSNSLFSSILFNIFLEKCHVQKNAIFIII